jgi:cytoskeletal protein CcmA (bactofilin family)
MARINVVCPHCNVSQDEPDAAISTVCRSCNGYFSLEFKQGGRRLKKQRPSRIVHCAQCSSEQKVYEDALSAVCTSCGSHLSIGSYTLEGVVRQRLSTSGDIVFTSSVRYSGPEVRAKSVTVSGWIKARIRATRAILLSKKSEVRGALVAPRIHVLKGADGSSDRVQTDFLEADGALRTGPVYVRQKLLIRKDGFIEASTLTLRDITVEPGGSLSGRLDTTAVPASTDGDDIPVEVVEEEKIERDSGTEAGKLTGSI